MKKEINVHNECWTCRHKREVPGNTHIRCAKPDAGMTGHRHGIERGWFMYPLLFDPAWKTKLCDNREADNAVSHAVSRSVSRAS